MAKTNECLESRFPRTSLKDWINYRTIYEPEVQENCPCGAVACFICPNPCPVIIFETDKLLKQRDETWRLLAGFIALDIAIASHR